LHLIGITRPSRSDGHATARPKAGAFRALPGGRMPVVEPFPIDCDMP